jgi:hypothetical protein
MTPFVAVECLVGDQHVRLHIEQQMTSIDQIVSLTTGQMETDRIPERIDQCLDFCAHQPRDRPIAWSSPAYLGPALC